MEPTDDFRKGSQVNANLDSDIAPDPQLLIKIQDQIAASLAPVRPIHPAWALQAYFLVLFIVLVATFSFLFGTQGLHALTTPRRWAFFSVLLAGAWLTSVSLSAEMVPGSRRRVHRLWLTGGIVLAFATAAVLLLPVETGIGFVVSGMPCFTIGCIVGMIAAFATWQLLRSGFIASEFSAQIAAATFCGVVATTVLEIHCGRYFLFHVLVWHLAPFLISGLAIVACRAIWRWFRAHSNIALHLLCSSQ